MSDASYWLKLAKLDQGTLGTSLAIDEKKQAVIFVGILTVSTACAEGLSNDVTGQQLQNRISNLSGFRVIIKVRKVVKDSITEIKNTLCDWTESLGLDLILTAGGSGFAPGDVTPEATKSVIEKEAPGFTVALVGGALKLNPVAMLFRIFSAVLNEDPSSRRKWFPNVPPAVGLPQFGDALTYRGICGIRRNVVILNLPDGAQASCDLLNIAMPVLPFAIRQLKTGGNLPTPGLQPNPIPTIQGPTPVPTATSTPFQPVHAAAPAHHAGLAPTALDAHAPTPHHAPPPSVDHHAAPSADHHGPVDTDPHHAAESGTSLLSQVDLDMLESAEIDNEVQLPSESLRIVGSRPASRGTLADSGVSSGIELNDVTRLTRRPRVSPYPPATVDKAYSTIIANSNALPITTKFFKDAIDFVVAEDVKAGSSVPPCATAINDGYAVIAADMPGDVEVIGGASLGKKLCPVPYVTLGKAVRITTGAPMPAGADAVILVEQTVILSESNDGQTELRIRCRDSTSPGKHIRQEGSDIKAQEVVIRAGTKLDHTAIGLLPTVDVCTVRVHRLPVVAVLSIGTELVEPDTPSISDGQTRDTNRITLLTAIRKQGITAIDCGIVGDGPRDFKNAITRAYSQADVVITTGGCSVGDNDYVKALISEIGATLQFGRVAFKPGAPTAFATLDTQRGKKLFFALPGVPSPALVAYYVLVCPCLRKLSGFRDPSPTVIKVKLSSDVYLSDVPEYQRATLRWEDNEPVPYADVTGRQAISRFLSMVGANSLLLLPARSDACPSIKRGSLIDAMVVGEI